MKSTQNRTKTTSQNLKHHNPHTLKRLASLAKPHKKKIFLALFCVIIVNVSLLLKPVILSLVIDDFLSKGIASKGFYSITTLGIAYFLIVAFSGIFSILQANFINKAGQEIMKDLRSKVFKTIQLLPLSYLDKVSSGRLITRATNDVESLSQMYTDVLISLFKDAILLIGIVCAMFLLNVKLAIISFCVIPPLFLLIFALKAKIKKNFENMKSLIGRINGFMAENISGMKIVQIFRGENEKKKEFLELNNAYYKTTAFQVWLNSFLKPVAEIFQNLAIAILIWYSMGNISNGLLDIGVLYAFTTYIKQFFAPIADLAENYTTIQSAMVSADRIFELIDQEAILEDLECGIRMDKFEGNIEFKNVWFSYKQSGKELATKSNVTFKEETTDGDEWILKNVSFKISKGETAAFVGETGAGKTTIISLISGFYKVQRGEILIDGINLNHINLRDLRKNVAVVLQDVFLFSGDIKSNIALNDNIGEDTIEEALKVSCANEFVKQMPNGMNEAVMERGSTFSAGQKQLFSIARALAHNPTILVLDEATANIDTKTEKLIQKAIDNASKDRTTLIIAHRLSTIRNANKIIVLKHGEIVEVGSHSQLMDNKGYYNNLINKSSQSIEEKEAV